LPNPQNVSLPEIASIAGYQIETKLSESPTSVVYRAHAEGEPHAVVLKLPAHVYPSPLHIAKLQREYELLRTLQQAGIRGVVTPYALATDQHRPVLVLEDCGRQSLAMMLADGPLPVERFLPLALQIAATVGQIHQQQVIHKDITPANIIWNPRSDQATLIDFGLATVLTREQPRLQPPNILEGTLAYLSPEQTGRMNRALDYRTDFYSLGATFYALLTGAPPFALDDALALVHAHLAHRPVPPHERNPTIPPPLSAIILKLLAKNAEERYQSAAGLSADLQECLQQWQQTTHIVTFPLGRTDRSDRFQLPHKLYGREVERRHLLEGFARVSHGRSELMLISGPAGIGKSALVQEVYKPMTQQHGYFSSGKFDQLQRSVPYSALTHALGGLIRQILTESDGDLARWRAQLGATLGTHAQALSDLIPEMAVLIGPSSPAPALTGNEVEHRLRATMQQFLNVVATPEHPLVLFLDDLQWADLASLALISALMTGAPTRTLYLIGAYRDNEVQGTHPLRHMLDTLASTGQHIEHVQLQALPISDVTALIADTLHCSCTAAQPLAELVHAKTDGNPFFVTEFLRALYTEGLIVCDFSTGTWQWDLSCIQARRMTDNVIALLTARLQRCAERTLSVLRLAACLGTRFVLQTVTAVSPLSPRETATALWHAVREGLLIVHGDAAELLTFGDDTAEEDTEACEYTFAHDRIHQAVYALIPEAERSAVHARIGHLLLHTLSPAQRESQLFVLVNHLTIGLPHTQDATVREVVCTLNVQAGKKAKAAAAYAQALAYFQVAIGLLVADGWERHYDTTLALYTEAAEAAYLSGAFPTLEQYADIVHQHAHTLLDTIPVYEYQIEATYVAQNKLTAGITLGCEVLARLGISVPTTPTAADVQQELAETQHLLAGKEVAQLIDLPTMRDPLALATMCILMRLYSPAYLASPELFAVITLRAIRLSLTTGNTALSARAYVTYGIMQCTFLGDTARGYQFGTLALDLVHRCHARTLLPSTTCMMNGFIRHWTDHVRETIPPLVEAYHAGQENGDVEFAAIAALITMTHSFWAGNELGTLDAEMHTYSEAIAQLKQGTILNVLQFFHQTVGNLLGRALDPCRLVGEWYDETVTFPVLIAANNQNALAMAHLNKLMLCYLFRDYQQALQASTIVEKYLSAMVGTSSHRQWYFYDALTRFALVPDASADTRATLLHQINTTDEQLQRWAQQAPTNFQHRCELIAAERARVMGHEHEARAAYDRAIDGARAQNYVQDEALSNELAARFYLAYGQTRVASHYLRDAHYAYQRWGALAKVKDLESHYPHLLESRSARTSTSTSLSASGSGPHLSSSFDFTSVLKASQTIASELVLDTLLTSLMQIVVENVGAQRGVLLLFQEGQLTIVAEHRVEQPLRPRAPHALSDTTSDLPVSLLRYVERTGESVVLGNASHEGAFVSDPYISHTQPKSLLCVPVMHQGTLKGLVYVENTLTEDAFTAGHSEVVTILSAQAAVSLENARLYQQLADYSRTLERRVDERTQALKEMNQDLVIANRQVQEATTRKSRFLASMSHELRTPLNAIMGFSDVLLEKLCGPLNAKQDGYVRDITAAGQHLLELIKDILDLAKVEAGRMELEPRVCNLRKVIENSLVMVRERAFTHGVTLSVDIAPGVETIVADERKLKQVLFNLLSNAIKFTPANGKIGVQAAGEDGWVRIAVWDTGVGIAQADQVRIFEEFHQVGKRGTTEEEGTGLGLALAQRFVEMHDGQLRVESMLGVGSTFTFTLPVAGPHAPNTQSHTQTELQPAQAVPHAPNKPRALIVEDDAQAAHLLQLYLTEAGYDIDVARSGTEGLAKLTQQRPDVVILDILLPDVDGWAVLASVKADPVTRDIPVIVTSMIDEKGKGFALGASEYLVKPLQKEDVLRRLEAIRLITARPIMADHPDAALPHTDT